MATSTIAVLDAAIAYGASRWYRGLHQNAAWEFKHQYKASDDKLLFYEFLHDILLYDSILLDRSSVGRHISTEILELFTKINTRIRLPILDPSRSIAPIKSLAPVIEVLSRLVSELGSIPETSAKIRNTPVPWAYSSDTHTDRPAFIKAFGELNVDLALLPFAIFLYRGICYAGFANNYSSEKSTPTVYLASPGRIRALAPVLSTEELKRIQYPKLAYADLVGHLKLPSKGYSFSQFPSLPPHYLSDLALQIQDKGPREALDYVLRIRQSDEAATLRKSWADRVWEHSKSAAIGSGHSQTISNSTITGDVTMVFHAAAVS
jgi:hypothetical protein